MTSKTVIQVTANGQLELPSEIRSQLQSGDEFLLWQEEDTIILKRVEKSTVEEMVKAKKGVNHKSDSHFFELCDRLHKLNEIDPISSEEIQAEIKSYRQEKHKVNLS
ncbi:MAG: AbrB/MazE/SpoVT family DNA-binding domain-containing protein [Okeania sp. SIO3B5]|uniref:AbrB/MazE/SpoVT family DNA-binding domain-containing protein n=1 Tax=Okeania sp. SIO3B5 TaxID=2607811 RepID=UPI0014010A05|nr:AbrB/MazE/SpoVT family DNA-binding domain-containing protein [Okeania sp. SIO3B5]NEO52173.1 AbrB/MazE/SpoVT family DNA-binding domain-containing protein [Okeania sp. SIO3B5]